MLLCGHPCSRPAFLEPCSVRVASPAESLRFRAWQGLKWAAGAALVGWGVLRLYERRPRRRRSSVVRGAAIPEDFRAAGVIFYTMNAQELGKLLLAVEERRVPLRELGLGSGSAQKRVLLFPQGKREPEDEDYVATARREFVEETADFGDLARHLKGPLEAIWYIAAKMAVVFCEVPASVVEESEEAAAPAKPAPRPRRQQARQQAPNALCFRRKMRRRRKPCHYNRSGWTRRICASPSDHLQVKWRRRLAATTSSPCRGSSFKSVR
ncbi:unnamed protein product [Durusdinium trenchii]|uniref:Nudix hydrolase domain-containing protein n=1 Tax=Durusdinium trenchii TaxID=1381693 RepID=A0ABP0R9S1_9DINO